MSEVLDAQKRLDEVYAAYAEEGADFDALAVRAGTPRGDHRVVGRGPFGADGNRRRRASASRRGTRRSRTSRAARSAASRCASSCCPGPTCCCSTSRRTTSTPRASTGSSSSWRSFPGTVVAVTHDRYFLDNAAEWILELDRGKGIPWKGNYSNWLEQKEQRLEIESKQDQARIRAMKQELEWVRKNPKGRQAKSKARITRFEELASYEHQKRNETAEIFIPVAERLGNEVIEFENVSKGFGDKLLIDDLSFRVPPGAVVGIIGPNGAGKTTLFRMITGKDKPDSGTIKIGHTVQLAVVDQTRESLPNDKTAWEAISNGQDILTVGKFEMQSRAYLGRFNFKGPDQQKLVGQLSGGERGRLHLAATLLKGGNVLLLDEPSNDLDVETLRALEEALLEFAGSVLVISHDRWFLDRIATHILAAEDDSKWTFFEGNYREYEEDKRERLGEEGARPHRPRYKPLMH